jgi:hypothetical protein
LPDGAIRKGRPADLNPPICHSKRTRHSRRWLSHFEPPTPCRVTSIPSTTSPERPRRAKAGPGIQGHLRISSWTELAPFACAPERRGCVEVGPCAAYARGA